MQQARLVEWLSNIEKPGHRCSGMVSDKFVFFSAQESGDESPEYDSHIYNDFMFYLEVNDTGSGIDMDVQILAQTPSGNWCVIDQRHFDGSLQITPVQVRGTFEKFKIGFAGYNVGALTASVNASAVR